MTGLTTNDLVTGIVAATLFFIVISRGWGGWHMVWLAIAMLAAQFVNYLLVY